MALSLSERAAQRVKHSQVGHSHRLWIPVTPGFQRASESQHQGVGSNSPEAAAAQAAICNRLLRELGVYRLPLREWVQAVAAGGSLPQLAARLVGMPLNRETRQSKPYKAEVRKLQEYAQGKYRDARGARRERIAAIGGPGNPYSSDRELLRPLRGGSIRIGARADWQISSQLQAFAMKAPDAEHWPSDAHRVVQDGGEGLLDYIADNTVPGESTFLTGDLYAIRIEFAR
jgi:hypothetical protein